MKVVDVELHSAAFTRTRNHANVDAPGKYNTTAVLLLY
jgi:hypothetical protein